MKCFKKEMDNTMIKFDKSVGLLNKMQLVKNHSIKI